uniref:Serine/threonine-protein kinase SMU1 (EC) n=1 Tax=Ganoderma boninense TaxID=34458 RepID=A0A5K1JVF8_9APHY|nr:Serine/threonine-protein kinase SMU1 (EC [Ganoderma boninense]
MAPRAKASTEAAEPTRRSSRISAQPKAESVEKPAKKAAAPKAKKRAAEAEGGESGEGAPVVKKSKAAKEEGATGDEEGAEGDLAYVFSKKHVANGLLGHLAAPALQPIAVGDALPSFTLKNEKDEDVDVATLTAEKGIVVFLVPKADTQLPYPLLSDPKRVLITALGAGEGGKTKRSHFIFEKGGKLLEKKLPVKPGDSPKLALEFIKGLSS